MDNDRLVTVRGPAKNPHQAKPKAGDLAALKLPGGRRVLQVHYTDGTVMEIDLAGPGIPDQLRWLLREP